MGVMLWYGRRLSYRNVSVFDGSFFMPNHYVRPQSSPCVYQVGQIHGGLMGVIQRAMVRSCPHVWFERAEMKDRHLVTNRSVFPLLSELVTA